MNENTKNGDITYPFIIVRVNDGLFCVNSKYVATIMELPEYESLPDAPPYLTGVFSCRDQITAMFDLRTALKQCTLAQEYKNFTDMLDRRKQDHIDWVAALEDSLRNGTSFSLAVDPHKCVLGKWYDNFESESNEVIHYLVQLEEPHKNMHQAAIHAQKCMELENEQERRTRIEEIMKNIKQDYVPKILEILEGAKEIFRNRVYHEMVLVLGGAKLGIVVDEVVSVENLRRHKNTEDFERWKHSPYISGIMYGGNMDEPVLEVNIPRVLQAADKISL